MMTFIVTVIAFMLFVAAMAVGVIFSNKELKGSCGGMANLQTEKGDSFCSVCGLPAGQTCESEEDEDA